jgi:hypothetical protein
MILPRYTKVLFGKNNGQACILMNVRATKKERKEDKVEPN